MSEWTFAKCQGCGAPIVCGRDDCEYCGRKIPWTKIIEELPIGYVVLFAGNKPAAIIEPD